MRVILNFIVALSAAALLGLSPSFAQTGSALRAAIEADYPTIEALYRQFHQNPELSFREKETSKRLAAELKALGFEVTTGVGDAWVRAKAQADAGGLKPGVGGYGVVAVMRNGAGPTLMLRADMDALPLEEKTGLPFASTVVAKDWKGQSAPVMHACAHDSHMAMLIGTARRLVAMKDRWSGTLVLVGQPAEELGLGALAMLADGLYTRFPKPDFILAAHTSGYDPAGVIAYTPGYALANVDSVDVTIRGVGAHGSAPHMGKDPIVIASMTVAALQTLISRETNALDSGVVTVGAFNAGFKHNIIPDEAKLQITVRSYKDTVRKRLLDGIRRIARAQALSAGVPEQLAPIVKVEKDYVPATYNDPALTTRVIGAVTGALSPTFVYDRDPSMGGEDFSQFGRTPEKIPTLIYWVGGLEPAAFRAARDGKGPPPPANHSPQFAPVADVAMKTGIEAMTASSLELLGK
jgi:hippurate hydrolase